jgi:flagellar biosynthetic protein FlhB
MADDQDKGQKTEEPTSKKLADAEDNGDVLQSPDVVSWLMLASATLLAIVWLGGAANQLTRTLATYLSGAASFSFESASMNGLTSRLAFEVAGFLAPPFLVLVAVAIGAPLLQRKFVFNPQKIQPNFAKINPWSGLGRILGRQALIQFGKGLIKIVCVSLAAFYVIWPSRERLPGLFEQPLSASLILIQNLLLAVLGITLVIYGIIAVFDYAWQYWERRQRLMMSRQEIKDEFKQAEGDPHIKGRLRQIRMQKAQRRMMASVPKASVVIMNPTHYAVALKYETGMAAPLVVAKGVDHMALKIRDIAKENNVPVVENPPLARALYATVDIDEAVKPEHFKAVAQVIGYVMRLKGKIGGRSATS